MPKVLVIHNDLETQETLLAFFRQKDFETVGYSDPEIALKEVEKGKLQADVIVTELDNSTMGEVEFIKKMKESQFSAPVLLISSARDVDGAMQSLQAGAFDIVMKPLNLNQLLVAAEKALRFGEANKESDQQRKAQKTATGVLDSIVGMSPGFVRAVELAKRVARSSTNVMITGESGTGKEVIARMIHSLSPRANAPFVAINCSAIPENLLESELFGYAKGAFTGAVDKKIGLLEEAEGGTLFLDEVGDLDLQLQAKLLRVLQERKIKRVGENQMRNIDVRIISATHKDLKREISVGQFREDLYFRLNVIHIRIPPLRDRREDILPLTEFFLRKYAAMNKSKVRGFEKEARDKLMTNRWLGNVRELENTIERAVVLCSDDTIGIGDLHDLDFTDVKTEQEFDFKRLAEDKPLTADKMMKMYIRYVLEKNNGAKEKTARELNIDRKTLYRKLQEMEFESVLEDGAMPPRQRPIENKHISLQ